MVMLNVLSESHLAHFCLLWNRRVLLARFMIWMSLSVISVYCLAQLMALSSSVFVINGCNGLKSTNYVEQDEYVNQFAWDRFKPGDDIGWIIVPLVDTEWSQILSLILSRIVLLTFLRELLDGFVSWQLEWFLKSTLWSLSGSLFCCCNCP